MLIFAITDDQNSTRDENHKIGYKCWIPNILAVYISCKILITSYRKNQWLTWSLHPSHTWKLFWRGNIYPRLPKIAFNQEFFNVITICSLIISSTVVNIMIREAYHAEVASEPKRSSHALAIRLAVDSEPSAAVHLSNPRVEVRPGRSRVRRDIRPPRNGHPTETRIQDGRINTKTHKKTLSVTEKNLKINSTSTKNDQYVEGAKKSSFFNKQKLSLFSSSSTKHFPQINSESWVFLAMLTLIR